MVHKTHKPGWRPKAGQQYFFSEWFHCNSCKSTWLQERFKVWVDGRETDIALMDSHLDAIRPRSPFDGVEERGTAGSASKTSVRGNFQRVFPTWARALDQGQVELGMGEEVLVVSPDCIHLEGNLVDGTAGIFLPT